MQTDIYIIENLTPLHAGSEDTGAGIVDKLVQRDPVTGIPVVHGSSIKGSLREFFEQEVFPEEKDQDEHVRFIFGSTETEKGNGGRYRFLEAELISIPVRSSMRPFFNASSTIVIESLLRQMILLGFAGAQELRNSLQSLLSTTVQLGKPIYFGQALNGLRVHDTAHEPQLGQATIDSRAKELLGSDVMLFHHDDFKELCRQLPVIARNSLENGESKNLWYEEVVPRHARFVLPILKPEGDAQLSNGLAISNNILQIGGNASVGYGFCTLKSL